MSRRLVALAFAVLAVAIVLSLLPRQPRLPAPALPPVAPQAPVTVLELDIRDGALAPAVASVPLGHRVALTIVNWEPRVVAIELSGYGDRVHVTGLAPGAMWEGEFLADRPGDDFAWMLDGRPSGRLEIRGSHLVEGHR
jgi:hypothetical protein